MNIVGILSEYSIHDNKGEMFPSWTTESLQSSKEGPVPSLSVPWGTPLTTFITRLLS